MTNKPTIDDLRPHEQNEALNKEVEKHLERLQDREEDLWRPSLYHNYDDDRYDLRGLLGDDRGTSPLSYSAMDSTYAQEQLNSQSFAEWWSQILQGRQQEPEPEPEPEPKHLSEDEEQRLKMLADELEQLGSPDAELLRELVLRYRKPKEWVPLLREWPEGDGTEYDFFSPRVFDYGTPITRRPSFVMHNIDP